MQPITEILKEIRFPIWLCWGTSLFALVASTVSIMSRSTTEAEILFAMLPITQLVVLLFTIGLLFYCANDLIRRRKERDEEMAKWKKEIAAMKTSHRAS